MVSEQFESLSRESQSSSYCVYEAMAVDMVPPEVDPTKKKVIPLKTLVSDLQQELQKQMAIYNQFLNQQLTEMAQNIRKEVRDIRSGSVPWKNTSEDFIPNGEDVVQTSDLSNLTVTTINEEEGVHEQFSDFTSETKSLTDLSGSDYIDNPPCSLEIITRGFTPTDEEAVHGKISILGHDSLIVTRAIREGEEREKVLPIEEKREVTMEQVSSDNTVHLGGDESTKTDFEDSYEYEGLGFCPGPDPEPPDVYLSPPQIRSQEDSPTIPITTERRKVNQMIERVSSIHYSSRTRMDKLNGVQIRPSPKLVLEKAQCSLRPSATKLRPILGLTACQALSVFTGQSFNLHEDESRGYKADHGDTKSRNTQFEGSHMGVDRSSPQTIESMLKQQSQPPAVQVIKNLMGKNVRTQLSPLSDKTHDAINQTLNTTNFGIRPNLDRKLSLNSNSKQDLKLPDQLLQSFHKPNCLLSSTLLSGNNAELFTSRLSPPCSLSSQLIQDQENVPKKREKPAVYLVENYRLLDIPEFLILVGDYVYRIDCKRIIKVHGETNVDIIVAAMPMDEKRVIAFGPLKINVYSKEGDDQYVMEVLKCLSEYTFALDLLEDHGALMYHLARTDMGMNMVIGTKVYMGIDPISSPFRVKLWSIVGELNPLSREIDIHQKGSKLSVGTMVVKDNDIGWVTNTKRNTDPRVHILIQESIQVEEGKKLNKVSKVITRLIGLIFVRCCHKVMKYFMWKCSNGWPGLMEFIGMVVKVKLAAVLFGDKTAQDEESIMLGSSIDYSINGTKLLEWFPVAGLCLKVENTRIQWYVAEYMSDRIAEVLVTLTVALKRKCDIMASHSRIGNDIMWSFCEGEMEHDWKDWTSMAAELGELAIGQQQFLYFFYPP